jgi:hypothetical protein
MDVLIALLIYGLICGFVGWVCHGHHLHNQRLNFHRKPKINVDLDNPFKYLVFPDYLLKKIHHSDDT